MGGMGGTCMTVSGLLVLGAGATLLAFGMGSVAGNTAHLVAGALFALVGLGEIMHGMGMCPMHKGKR
ncbi:MAG: hypothetical protein HYY37_05305 [Candidatus Aenigmarchaeota archaeon]|nr:hypothetical protein [Candidatus Aenigmarchaeota archaeon]